jgi:hypothetical protein
MVEMLKVVALDYICCVVLFCFFMISEKMIEM